MVALQYPNPTTYQQWATDLLDYMGDPVTASNVAAISAWEQAEEPLSQFLVGWNPLNTERGTGSAGTKAAEGAPNIPTFPSLQSGLAATADTIDQSNFSAIAATLRGGNATATLGNVLDEDTNGESAWGTSGTLVNKILEDGGASIASGNSEAGGANAESDLLPGNPNDNSINLSSWLPTWLTGGLEDLLFVVLGVIMVIVAFVIAGHAASSGGGGGSKKSIPKEAAEVAA